MTPVSSSGLTRGGKAVTDWPSIRLWVLNRDRHVCQTCKNRPATEVDHVWPRRLGGEDHISNLRAICGSCNKTKGARVDLAAAPTHRLLDAEQALSSRISDLSIELREVRRQRAQNYLRQHDRESYADFVGRLDSAWKLSHHEYALWNELGNRWFPQTAVEALATVTTDSPDLLNGDSAALDTVWRLTNGSRVLARYANRTDALSWLSARREHADEDPAALQRDETAIAELLPFMTSDSVLLGAAVALRHRHGGSGIPPQ